MYRHFVDQVRKAEDSKTPGKTDLTAAVARYLAKVMSYKDEYEVARLYTSGDFAKQVDETFEGNYTLKFNLAPPILSKKDPITGHLKKQEFGAWTFSAFKQLAKLKHLRGGKLDVFGKTEERKMERQLIVDYKNCVEGLLGRLNPENHALAVEIAKIPEMIRGYGHVKEAHYGLAKSRWDELLEQWQKPSSSQSAA